jgi:DNA-binding CsgD family transcriptional regulator
MHPIGVTRPQISGDATASAASSAPPSQGELDPLHWALDRYGEPLFVIDENRRLLFRNEAAQRVLRARKEFSERGGQLCVGSTHADAALQNIIAGADRPSARAARSPCRGIRLARAGAARDWLLVVHPFRARSQKEPATIFFIQIIGRARPRGGLPVVLNDLFKLSAREIAVLSALLRTGTAHKAARRLVLSHETVRSHLKRIFRKCDVHSQAELMTLLDCISRFAGVA